MTGSRTGMVVITSTAILAVGVMCQDLQCYVPGEVVGGLLLGPSKAYSYNECLGNCRKNDTCTWFTFFSDASSCFEYSSCQSIEPICQNCFTGQVECSQVSICREPGFCQGVSIDVPPAEDETACIAACFANEQCNWYSYFPSLKQCFLSVDCGFVDLGCTDGCTHGERSCYNEELPKKLLVVGGKVEASATDNVELVDLSVNGRSCSTVSAYPLKISGGVGTFLNEVAIVCGGVGDGSLHHAECFSLNVENQTWLATEPMLGSREYAAGVLLSDDRWWITGGFNEMFELRTTEVKQTATGSMEYVPLPVDKFFHQLVKINESHVAVVGGEYLSSDVWLFDSASESWIQAPDMPESNDEFQAGLAKFKDGRRYLVVAGGDKVNFCYGLDLDMLTWNSLPLMPTRVYRAVSVTYGNTFLIVGGLTGRGNYSDVIYQFDPDNEKWLVRSEKLSQAREGFTSFFVPDDYVSCA